MLLIKQKKIIEILNSCNIHRKSVENSINVIVKEIPNMKISDLNINDDSLKFDIEKIDNEATTQYDNIQEELATKKNAIR